MRGGGIVESANSKIVLMLGMKDEVIPIDMSYVNDREAILIADSIHYIMWKELLSRTIRSMHDWSSRSHTLFLRYDFVLIGHLAVLSKNEVDQLEGCGYRTRKEVYDICKSYGLILPNWFPGTYYRGEPQYVFKD